MRLQVLEHERRWPARVFVRVAELVLRHRMDNVVLTATHRPELWGRPFFTLAPEVLRGPSWWTVGEREYLAAAVSRANQCSFCARAHTETTRIEAHGEVSVDDPTLMRPELAAAVELVEKLATDPDAVTPADVDAVRRLGVPDDAIEDALHVCFLFSSVNRMADAFGWSWDSDEHVRVAARVIHRVGYKLPGFTLR